MIEIELPAMRPAPDRARSLSHTNAGFDHRWAQKGEVTMVAGNDKKDRNETLVGDGKSNVLLGLGEDDLLWGLGGADALHRPSDGALEIG